MWADVVGFDGRYQISDLNKGVFSAGRGRFLALGTSKKGYITVQLCRDCRPYSFFLHSLVWRSFVGPIPKGLEINHKDGVKSNNCLSNLEVVTHRDNMLHARDIGLLAHMNRKGTENPNCKITNDVRAGLVSCYLGMAVSTRRRAKCYYGAIIKLASQFQLSRCTVRRVLREEGLVHARKNRD